MNFFFFCSSSQKLQRGLFMESIHFWTLCGNSGWICLMLWALTVSLDHTSYIHVICLQYHIVTVLCMMQKSRPKFLSLLSLLLFSSVCFLLSPQPLIWLTTSAHHPCPVLLLALSSWWQPCWWLTGSCPCSWVASFTSSMRYSAVSSGWPA